MGFFDRLTAIVNAKLHKGLDAIENPKEMLDFSLKKMEEQYRTASRSAADVATAKRKLELQHTTVVQSIRKYEEQAKKALELGQEEMAREALVRKQQAADRAEALASQIAGMDEQLNAIARSQEELKYKIDSFRRKKEMLKALYDASQAQLKVQEIMTSVGSEAESVGRIVERAEARIAEMQARVAAVDDLVARGIVEETLPGTEGDFDRRLSRLTADVAVEAELAKMKAELQGGRKEGE